MGEGTKTTINLNKTNGSISKPISITNQYLNRCINKIRI